MATYRIVGWDDYFEYNESRKLRKLSWIKIPNQHDGGGYCELLDHPNGMGHFGAWLLLVQVASKMPIRGTLVNDRGRALTPKDIATRTRGDVDVIAQAIPRLIEIGWLEDIENTGLTESPPESPESPESPDDPGESPDPSGESPDRPPIEEKRGEERRGEEKESCSERGSSPADGLILKNEETWIPDDRLVGELKKAYPHVDIHQEIKKAAAWCLVNPAKRKTKRGIARFLNSWCSRASPPSGETQDPPALEQVVKAFRRYMIYMFGDCYISNESIADVVQRFGCEKLHKEIGWHSRQGYYLHTPPVWRDRWRQDGKCPILPAVPLEAPEEETTLIKWARSINEYLEGKE